MGLFQTFRGYNCRTAEINPMVITKEGKIFAGDCRMAIDDSSVFRHPELGIEVAREAPTPPTELDKIAWQIEEGGLPGREIDHQSTGDRRIYARRIHCGQSGAMAPCPWCRESPQGRIAKEAGFSLCHLALRQQRARIDGDFERRDKGFAGADWH